LIIESLAPLFCVEIGIECGARRAHRGRARSRCSGKLGEELMTPNRSSGSGKKKEQLQILSPLVAEAKTAKLISIHNHIKGSESRSRMNY
jgi:hypothetical protein